MVDCLHRNHFALAVALHGQVAPDAPENALRGMAEALADGALALQLDVRRSADGELLLMHDASLDRTTTGRGSLSQMDFSEIRKARLKTSAGQLVPEPPPSLDEALIYAKRRGAILILSPKGNIPPEELVEALRQNGMTNRVIVLAEDSTDAARYAASPAPLMVAVPAPDADALRSLLDQSLPPSRLVAYLSGPAANLATIAAISRMGVPSMAVAGEGDAVSDKQKIDAGLSFLLTDQPGRLTDELARQEIEGAECFMSAR